MATNLNIALITQTPDRILARARKLGTLILEGPFGNVRVAWKKGYDVGTREHHYEKFGGRSDVLETLERLIAIANGVVVESPAPSPEHDALTSLLVIGPVVITGEYGESPTHPDRRALYVALKGAGYASASPLGEDRHEYKITPAGVEHCRKMREQKS